MFSVAGFAQMGPPSNANIKTDRRPQSKIDEIQLKKNVHFNKEGYKLLATQVAESIMKALGK